MREGWVEAELMNVCTLQRGFDLPRKDRTSGAVPLMSSSGSIDRVAIAKVAGPGVVTGRSGSIGQVYFVEDNFWPLNTTLYVKDFHGNYPRFVYYLLSNFDLTRFTSGAGVPTLNRNHVHNELVRIPRSITEQKRIVARLDEAFAGIGTAVANTEKNLANARELFESHLNEVFSQRGKEWAHRPLVKTCRVFTDGDWIETKDQSENGIRLIQTGNVGVGEFKNRANKARFISDETFLRLKCQEVHSQDCLVSRLPDPVGRSCIIPELEDRMITAVDCTIIRFDESMVIPEFFNYFSQSSKYIARVEEYCTGATRKRISRRNLGKVEVPTPLVTEQKEFVAKFDEFAVEQRRLQSIYQQKLTALAELKQSLLKKAFSGELTTSPQDEIETALA